MFVLFAFLIFTGALGAAAYYVWSLPRRREHDALGLRLRGLRASWGTRARAWNDLVLHERRSRFAPLGDFLVWIGSLRRLQESIDQANLKFRAPEFSLACLAIAVVAYFALSMAGLRPLALSLVIAAVLGALPLIYVLQVRRRRLRKFEEGLPDAIDLFSRSMRAGHNIHAGLAAIAEETFDPVRMEFRKVIEELALGAPLEQTLHGLARRVPLIDLKFFVTGLILQRQTGADLAAVLENLALLVRERLNLAARMKAATAQQRLSARLLCLLPVGVGLVIWLLRPEYIRLLYTTDTGQALLTYALISEAVGLLIIRRIASPRY